MTSGSSDTPNPPTLQGRIETMLLDHAPDRCWWKCHGGTAMSPRQHTEHVADAITQLLIDMAGHGELLASIDRMYR